MKKKPYQRPVTLELPLTMAVPIVATSPLQFVDPIPISPGSGDVDPEQEVDEGL